MRGIDWAKLQGTPVRRSGWPAGLSVRWDGAKWKIAGGPGAGFGWRPSAADSAASDWESA